MQTNTKKLLPISCFKKGETIIDAVGNVFVKPQGAARILKTSLVTLRVTHIKKGLRPLNRRIGPNKVYLLEDLSDYYYRRA